MLTRSNYVPVRYEGVQTVKLIGHTAGTGMRFSFLLHFSPLENLQIVALSYLKRKK